MAQIKVGEKIKNKVNERANQKTDEAIDKGLDKTEEGVKEGTKKKDKDKKSNSENKPESTTDKTSNEPTSGTSPSSTQSSGSASSQADMKSYSKFDFVPGDQVTFFEDFSQDAIGDFPVNWNTNGTGEVVTVGSFDGRWLKWSAGVSYSPNLKTSFPDNFTLEFDILLQKQEDKENPYFSLAIYSSDKDNVTDEVTAGMVLNTGHWKVENINGGDFQHIGESQEVSNTTLYNKKTHISIWGQKQRMRVYVNETKVLDLPKAFPQGVILNRIKFSNNPGLNLSNDDAGPISIANIRVAVGSPDMRSKLMTEGKLVTRGILFDVNSDKIKGESYGTLKEISQVLKDNPTVKVKINGHTDSDGDDKANLDLSKRRAASVKNSLSKDFGIDASRMETDGKGESESASPNTTPEGKANNRRVEFIKL